jgi:hypothetical protein
MNSSVIGNSDRMANVNAATDVTRGTIPATCLAEIFNRAPINIKNALTGTEPRNAPGEDLDMFTNNSIKIKLKQEKKKIK